MHGAHGVDAGVAHRHPDRFHRLVDLGVPADLLGQEVAGMGDADAQALVARAPAGGLADRRARENRHVRRQHPFRAARHDERDPALDRARRELEMRRQRIAQCGDRILPGEVVHPTVALGLAEHCENGRRLERAAVDKRHQAGDIAGPAGRNANDVE
jgi:hypothetical protein